MTTDKKIEVKTTCDYDSYVQAWYNILNQPSIQELDPSITKLIDDIAKIGYDNANSKLTYTRNLSYYLSRWGQTMQLADLPLYQINYYKEVGYWSNLTLSELFSHKMDEYYYEIKPSTQFLPRKTTSFLSPSAYTKDKAGNLQAKSLGRQSSKYMKRLIPLSYAVLFAIFLSLSAVFGFAFYNGLHGGKFVVGLWTNLMLFVAAVGLTTTVFVACSEWRSWQGEFQERQGKISKHRKPKRHRV